MSSLQPERLSGDQYSICSDVWSTGITLLELVQNRFPFPTDLSQIELMMYITQNEVCRPDFLVLLILTCGIQPPELEDDDDATYSPEMKNFLKVACVLFITC